MLLRPFLNDAGSCASYLFGCTSHAKLAVVDPHADFVEDYVAAAAAIGAPIAAVFETHVQADHVSGLPGLVERTGATAYLPAGAGVAFDHVALEDGEVVELGNTLVTAIATPGHAPAHHAYTVADRRRGSDEPWLVFSGDSLLIGDKCAAHTVPYVEAKNSSITFEHEAHTSKISEDMLFYAKSRGLDDEAAVALVVSGFVRDVIQQLPMEFAVEAQKLIGVSLEGSVG